MLSMEDMYIFQYYNTNGSHAWVTWQRKIIIMANKFIKTYSRIIILLTFGNTKHVFIDCFIILQHCFNCRDYITLIRLKDNYEQWVNQEFKGGTSVAFSWTDWEKFNQDRDKSNQDSNWLLPEYKSVMLLLTLQTCSAAISYMATCRNTQHARQRTITPGYSRT
jgi:hypothetical protein